MRHSSHFSLVALFGLAVQIAACAEGSTFGDTGGAGGEGGSSNTGGNGGTGGDGCTAEVCDSIDNDCDGTVDEGCDCNAGETQPCYSGPAGTSGIGQCKDGTQECDAATNKWGPCSGEVLPGIEICNGSDEDCNGTPDDGLPELMCGIGACAAVAPSCIGGQPATCLPGMPLPELCDGIDNDCDQMTDESFPEQGQACDTGLLGVCSAGISQCTAGALKCAQSSPPSNEQCDGLDNDCNGLIDDNLQGLGAACSTGALGVCAAGTLSCQNGKIDCFPNTPASPEMCDGLDNDCNGTVDDGNPGGGGACNTGQMGTCANGLQVCMNGTFVCQPAAQGQSETCNGTDDNCNGQIDEGNPGGGQACTCGGTAACTNGQLLCSGCTREVICNDGIDDDGAQGADCQDSDCALGCNASVSPCAAGEKLFVLTSSDTPKNIPDNSSTTSTMTFSETLTVKRVVVQINVTHPWIQDMDITLRSPSNTAVELTSDNGGTGDNYTNTIFSGSCATSIVNGTPPFGGCYQPEQSLSAFVNQPLKGTWTLTVLDDQLFDSGTLNSWTVAICAQ